TRDEIGEFDAHLSAEHAPARPDSKHCAGCPVRHLCEGYWADATVAPLRWTAPAERGTPGYRDAELEVLEIRSEAAVRVRFPEHPDERVNLLASPSFGLPLTFLIPGRRVRVLGATFLGDEVTVGRYSE